MFCLLDVALTALGGVAAALVGAAMLLHVVLACEGLVALGAEGVLLAGVLLGVASGMARGGEEVVAAELLGHGARVAVLLGAGVQRRLIRVLRHVFRPEVGSLGRVGVVRKRAG